ncbi:MAG: tRNA 2-thiocytidine biosynthesis TtcA family protein [Prevotella sp.]|nr:tRNA 2-thiocytidine biosynthesis TtcA family protein [Prevotella sp.]
MTERERLFRKINERFVRAFVAYRLLEDDDHVLVGLSGGKDSLLLTELLARRARIHHPRFRVEAIHVRMEDVQYATDPSYLQHFCDELGVPLHVVTTSIASLSEVHQPVAEGAATGKKPPCFLCSWQRRKQFFNYAQELGCNKIALGHHQDDLLHTALMNLLYQGRFDTMPARLQMKKMPLQIIRPLCLVAEPMIEEYAQLSHYEQQVKHCPYEHDTNRTAVRRLFEQAEQENPEVRFSLWNALEREGKIGNHS